MASKTRLATAADLETVNRLLQDVLRIHNEGRPDIFKASGKKYSDDELTAIFENPDTPVFVYEEDGKVLGYIFCAIERHDGAGSLRAFTTLYIDDLCVSGESRGKGVGRILYKRAEELARELGCHNITLHVWQENPGARAFYEALGMKPQYTCMETILK